MKMLECWAPSDDAGAPVACLATSFTFDSDFFTEYCLSQFLNLSARDPDGATGLDIAGMLEEEEALSAVRVSVLIDQSCRPDPRNLRWDLIPIRVPGALLHAKVALLIWERAARVIIGSANLTSAGYRNQVELATTLDLDGDTIVPRSVFVDLAAELRSILGLASGESGRPGPLQRAAAILDLFDQRIDDVRPPASQPTGMRFVIAPGGIGRKPLDRFDDAWSGPVPQSMMALSPFWDDKDAMDGATEALKPIAKRSSGGERRSATFVVPVDSNLTETIVRAPRRLRSVPHARIETSIRAFKAIDERRLHAKCLQYRSASWIAVMFGSSNITAKGLGLDARPHRELNLWIGCKEGIPSAKALRGLISMGDLLSDDLVWDPSDDDEDATDLTPLPAGFGEALLVSTGSIDVAFDPAHLPETWSVDLTCAGQPSICLFDSGRWAIDGRPSRALLDLPAFLTQLPSFLEVTWQDGLTTHIAPWLVNVGDGAFLPPPMELRSLPADVLLAVLASTRPLRAALEHALATRQRAQRSDLGDLDPLKRFDSSGFLLQRTRRTSAALWGIERRLTLPIRTMESLEWRLSGTLGPEHIAGKITEAATAGGGLPGEAHFLLAELVMTMQRIDWVALCEPQLTEAVRRRVTESIGTIALLTKTLDAERVPDALIAYLNAALDLAGATT